MSSHWILLLTEFLISGHYSPQNIVFELYHPGHRSSVGFLPIEPDAHLAYADHVTKQIEGE